jgi:hypothetical protein
MRRGVPVTDRKLVSVITPTWDRHDLLMACIENVRAQTYRPLEHVIVSDGPDPSIRDLAWRERSAYAAGLHDVPIRFEELGRNWSSYLPDSYCAGPLVVAQLLARGEYQMFGADDEWFDPRHIELLVSALEAEGADFAYSRCRFWRTGTSPEQGYDIGLPVPVSGQITNALYKTDLLKIGLYPFRAGMTSDFKCLERWMQAGATWAFVPMVTMQHRADH